LSNRVIELDKNTFIKELLNNITNYYITEKTDGTRTIIYINKQIYAINNTLEILSSDIKSNEDLHKSNVFVFDCEKYVDEKGEIVYYIFDVMVWKNEIITNEPFEFRLNYFKEVSEMFSFIKEKPFVKLTENFRDEIKNLNSGMFERDGIVFTPADGRYVSMRVYKYKPIEKITIDLLIKKCPENNIGLKPFIKRSDKDNLYILFCGINKTMFNRLNMQFVKNYEEIFKNVNTRNLPQYFPIQFSPSDKTNAYIFHSEDPNLDGKIGEMSYFTGEWQILKFRDDKQSDADKFLYFGNNYKVSEITWSNYKNVLNIENDTFEDVYFKVNENDVYKQTRNYNSYVISTILKNFKNTDNVLDMASGKGQQLVKYIINHIGQKLLLCVDNDFTALQELNSRKFDIISDKKYENYKVPLMIHQLDLNNNYEDNIKILNRDLVLPVNKFDLITCNLAFHYLIGTVKNLENIIKFIDHFLKKNSRFIFTSFDGASVVKLLNLHNGRWKTDDGKYDIIKDYVGDSLLPIGQKIKAILPFSNKQYYTEYLVNIEFISKEFSKYGITLEVNESYLDYYKKYDKKDLLTKDDLIFIGLYKYYSFYKR
jgi:SAM-dependent methyltransferase